MSDLDAFWRRLVIRLADEGVPIRVIARTFQRPYDEIHGVIRDAINSGRLVYCPASDWDRDTSREDRRPTTAPVRAGDTEDLVWSLMPAFGLTRSEATCLAALLRRGNMTKAALHMAVYPDPDQAGELKIIDVYIHKVRRKIRPFGIEIDTIWGQGYSMTGEAVAAVQRVIAERQSERGERLSARLAEGA